MAENLEHLIRRTMKRLYPNLDSGTAITRWWNRSNRSQKRRSDDRKYWEAANILSAAEFWIDADRSTVAGGKLTNLGTGGSALDATFGSTTGTDTNDPTRLRHSGTNYLYLPGTSSLNSATVPDSVATSITGNLELVARVALDDWTLSGQAIMTKDLSGANNRSWDWFTTTGGALRFDAFQDAAGTITATGSSATLPSLGFVNGQTYWLKVTFEPTIGGTSRTVFYWAQDQATEPTTWNTISTLLPTVLTSINDTTEPLAIGNRPSNALNAAGKFYRCIMRNGIGGTTVFDADFTKGITSGGQTTFTESSANAATVTINRATAGRKSVAVVRNVLLLGTDDYLEVASNSLIDMNASQSFTALMLYRQHATPASNARLIQKGLGTSPRWLLFNDASLFRSSMQVNDNTLSAQSGNSVSSAAGNLALVAGVVDRSGQTVTSYINGTAGTPVSTATVGSLSNADTMRIGAAPGAGSFFDGEIVAAAVFRRALSAAEIANIVSYYGAS